MIGGSLCLFVVERLCSFKYQPQTAVNVVLSVQHIDGSSISFVFVLDHFYLSNKTGSQKLKSPIQCLRF